MLRRRAGLIVAVLLCGGPSAAQDREPEPEGLRLGPAIVTPGVELANVGVDTNILRETGAARRDMVATVGADARVTLAVRPVRIKSSHIVGFDYYARYADQRSVNRWNDVKVEVPLTRLTLFASGALINARERFSYDMDSRVRRFEQAVAFGAEFRFTPKTAVAAEAGRTHTSFNGDAFVDGIPVDETLGHRIDHAAALLRFRATRLTAVVVRAETEVARFNQSPVRNSTRFRLTPGLEFQSRALIAGTALFGYQQVRPEQAGIPDYTGPVVATDLSLPLPGAVRLHVGATHDFEYSYQVAEPVYVLTAGRLGVERRLADRWQVRIGAGRQRLSYRSIVPDAQEFAPPSRIDRRIVYDARTAYQINRLLSVGIESEYTHRRSTRQLQQFEDFRLGALLRYGFPR